MEDLGPASDDQVILSWLQAEIELICVRLPGGGISLLEGHTRATAMVLEGHRLKEGIEAYIGDSPSINNWAYV